MVRESWAKMQVPIIGIIGILVIFLLIVLKMGLNTNNVVGQAYTDYAIDAEFTGTHCNADLYDPVCGSDGVTYDNLCLLKVAGVAPEYQGTCRN